MRLRFELSHGPRAVSPRRGRRRARATLFALAGLVTSLHATAQVASEDTRSRMDAALHVFDRAGAGDRDGRVEFPDVNPETVALQLSDASRTTRERSELFAALQVLCLETGVPCPRDEKTTTADHVRAIVSAVVRRDAHLIVSERLRGPGAVRTDSLRGIHDGADPAATHPWLWTWLVLNGLGVPTTTRSQTGTDRGFPVSPERMAQWFPGYLGALDEQVAALAGFAGPMVSGPEAASISIRGRTAATLHEAVSRPAELAAEDFAAPGMLFLAQEAPANESLIESAVRHIEARSPSSGRTSSDAFLLVTFGANDLFSYRQIVVAAREVTAANFERDLRRLDASTAPLAARGVRRIYVFPPPVEAVFDHHRIPEGARFTDGGPVPEGSRTLLHWWQSAIEGRRIPRQVVLSSLELLELRRRQDAFFAQARRVLGVESNWLVVDARDAFLSMLERVYGPGISIDGVPGYGTITFSGSNAVMSTDSIHPTPFGYLLWAEMALEKLRVAGVALQHDVDLRPGDSHGPSDELNAILRRVADQVRRSPSFFRPGRFPLDPEHRAATSHLSSAVERLDDETPEGWADAYRSTAWIWPYVPEYLLEDLWKAVRPNPNGPPRLHHEAVAELRRVFEVPEEKWSVAMRDAYRDLVVRFAEDGAKSATRHSGFSRASFAALGCRSDRLDSDFSRGHTPSLLEFAPRLALSAEASAAGAPRIGRSLPFGRAALELVAYRTPLAYLPLGITDFTRMEGRLGLGVVHSLAAESGVPSTYFEASVAPIGATAFIDSLPNLVVILDVPAWRPLVALGESCDSVGRCAALARFSAGIGISWWPNRDPAFNAGLRPDLSLYASLRAIEAFGDQTLPLAAAHLEGAAGAAFGF